MKRVSVKQALSLLLLSFCIAHAQVIEFSDNNNHPLDNNLPIIIDIYGNHCQPCKRMAPIFLELSNEFAGKALFIKIESSQNLAAPFGVHSIPTFIFLKRGAEVFRKIGSMSKSDLRHNIQRLLDA